MPDDEIRRRIVQVEKKKGIMVEASFPLECVG
jgi:hypothetical protein